MTPHQILIVVIRLLAIILFLRLVAGSAPALRAVGEAPLVIWIIFALQFVVCAFMWFFPATLASILLRSGDKRVSAASVPFDNWRQLAVASIGIFVLARAVPDATYWLLLAGSDLFAPSELFSLSFEQKVSAVSTVVEVVVGSWLTFGAKHIGAAVFHSPPSAIAPDSEQS